MTTRVVGEDIVARMRSREIVRPFIARIGPLVDRAVLIEALVKRDPAGGPELRREAEVLAEEARADLRRLEAQLEGLPATVLAQSRIVDTRKALLAVAERLDALAGAGADGQPAPR